MRGTTACQESSGSVQVYEAGRCGTRAIGLKLDCLYPNLQGAAEVAATEDHAGEVEVKAMPGAVAGQACGVGPKVGSDDADDSVVDLAFGLPGEAVVLARVVGGLGLVGHAQVGAEDVDAGLPLVGPVVGEAGHSVNAGEADGGGVVAKLFGGCGEPLVEEPGFIAVFGGLVDALAAVGGDECDGAASAGGGGEGDLEQVVE